MSSAAAAGGGARAALAAAAAVPAPPPPAFFHRTSFNSKYFPDCARRTASDAGGGPADYCRPQWVTPPLSDAQAGRLLKPHMYAFDERQVDAEAFKTACRPPEAAATAAAGAIAPPRAPEEGCDAAALAAAGAGDRVPVLPAARLGPGGAAALAAAEAAFLEVLEVWRRLPAPAQRRHRRRRRHARRRLLAAAQVQQGGG